MKRVLVVDDEPQMLRALDINLRVRHYAVAAAPDGRTALHLASRKTPDAVILDLGLPDMDGIDVIHGLRAWSPVPVIVLSGRSGVADRVEALDAGADDYLTKPFAMDELAARLRAVLRRPVPIEAPCRVDVGAFTVDLSNRTVTRRADGERPAPCSGATAPDGGRDNGPDGGRKGGPGGGGTKPEGGRVHLTPTEWRLVSILLRNPERLVTGRQLLTEVWGKEYEQRTQYLRVFMAGLRRKLEHDPARPRHLITEPGVGYRFQP